MIAFVQSRKFLAAVFLLAMTVCNLALLFRVMPSLRNGYQDFTIFYAAARMVRSGQSHALYDLSAQYRTQLTFAHVAIRQGPLPYNHPPFEALLFVPFTLLEYWPAYLLWTALNLIMLAVSVTLLRRCLPQFAAIPPLVLGLGATAFFPVAIGIIQGQDVILLLLLFVLAVICLDRGNDAAAGTLLAAGLFRPHLVVPLVVLLAIRRWRMLVGFAPVALLLAGISVAIMGWRGPLDYARFVLRLEGTGARAFGPEVVPNLRGLIANLPGLGASRPWSALLIFAASMVVFFVALRRIRNGRDSLLFASGLAAGWLRMPDGGFRLRRKATICQRSCSGNPPQLGIPLYIWPFLMIQAISPSVAVARRSLFRLGREPLPSAFAPWHLAQLLRKRFPPASAASGLPA